MINTYITITNASMYPKAPRAGIPSTFGVMSVVHMILELIRSAMTHSPITILRTSLRSRFARLSVTCKSRLIFACPFRYPLIMSDTMEGMSNAFRKERRTLFPLLFNSFFISR